MPGEDKNKGIICHSPVDFERKEKAKILKEPGGFGKNLEKDLIRSIRKGGTSKGKEKR